MKSIKLVVIAVLCMVSTLAIAQKAPGSPAAVYNTAITTCTQANPSVTNQAGEQVASPARIACDLAAMMTLQAASSPAMARAMTKAVAVKKKAKPATVSFPAKPAPVKPTT